MAEKKQELTHKGRKIVIEGGEANTAAAAEASGASVTIDNEPIPVRHDATTGKYIATAHSPFMSFDSLTELGKHVAEHVIGKRPG